jgi:hypothetical protein
VGDGPLAGRDAGDGVDVQRWIELDVGTLGEAADLVEPPSVLMAGARTVSLQALLVEKTRAWLIWPAVISARRTTPADR